MRLRPVVALCLGLLAAGPALSRGGRSVTLTDQELLDHIHGGWLGKGIGVTLGGPWEFQVPWPPPEIAFYRDLPNACPDQDDLYVQLVSLVALERKGPSFTCKDIGALWPEDPRSEVIWAANRAAYENILNGILPPDSGHPMWNASWDAIDAQIEADVFGMVAPAMVDVGAEAGFEGSHVTNWGRGAYGAVFVAACYSAAFFEPSVDRIVRSALATIPPETEYATMIRLIRGWHGQGVDWREARERLSRVYEPQHTGISAMINSGAVAIALLWGEGDYAKTICIATMCGCDSDCNPATAGGIVGCWLGASKLPQAWVTPLGDRYQNRWAVPKLGKEEFTFTEFAERTERVAARFLRAHGAARVAAADGAKGWRIPLSRPRPVALEQADAAQIARWRGERLQELVTRFAPGWTLLDCGPDMEPGVRADYLGRKNVLVIHPLDRETGAKLVRTVRGTGKPARLTLTVTSFDGQAAGMETADWVLRVRLGDKVLLEKTIGRVDGKPTWQTFEVDLTPELARGREAKLTIENAPDEWAWEAGYFASIETTGVE